MADRLQSRLLRNLLVTTGVRRPVGSPLAREKYVFHQLVDEWLLAVIPHKRVLRQKPCCDLFGIQWVVIGLCDTF